MLPLQHFSWNLHFYNNTMFSPYIYMIHFPKASCSQKQIFAWVSLAANVNATHAVMIDEIKSHRVDFLRTPVWSGVDLRQQPALQQQQQHHSRTAAHVKAASTDMWTPPDSAEVWHWREVSPRCTSLSAFHKAHVFLINGLVVADHMQ